MLLRVCFSLLFIHFIDARVSFNHSVILDEFDFRSQSSVSIDSLCVDTCHIYASITPESRKLADNILIQTAKGFSTLSSVADLRDSSTNRKLFLEVNNSPTLTIVNGNSGNTVGPLVLYVFNKAAAYFGNAEVYEAEGLDRSPTPVQAITVISARPFTLTEASYASLRIRRLSSSFSRGPFPGFSMTINAPIVSLLYDVQQFHFPAGELKATIGISNTHQMQLSGFINSPGYHGCAGKPAYQSSLYDFSSPIVELLQDSDSQDISLDVITNSDEDHSLVVKNSAGDEIARRENTFETWIQCIHFRFHDTDDVNLVTAKFNDYSLQFSWTPQQQSNKFFLVRYNSTAMPDFN